MKESKGILADNAFLKVKLVVFDLDGTLVNAYEAIVKSVNFTLKKMGYPEAAPKKICKAVGWGDKRLLAVFVKENDLEQALLIYRAHHRASLRKYAKLLAFTQEVLTYLRRRKYKIAIASNRPTEFTHIIVEHLGIKKYFDYILCADTLQQGKPHPQILLKIMKQFNMDASEAIFVGDMAVDIQTARNAGVRGIAVPTGSSTLSEIKKARPFKIIKNLAFLKEYL